MEASGLSIVPGEAEGAVVACEEGLSFWGGVDAATGQVIDASHPLHGRSLAGCVVAMPTSRGSCSGSGVLLELALNGHAPAALVFREDEDVLTLGALIAGRLFGRTIPVLRLGPEGFAALARAGRARLTATRLEAEALSLSLLPADEGALDLSDGDRALLAGEAGEAPRLAMEVICAMAAQQGATALTDVTQAHIDGCIYASPANLRFAERMAAMGARVRVPTTMNAISVDHANWRAQGVPPAFGLPASRLADAYVAMGAQPSFTCAPYLLDTAPGPGEAVGWAESNAVIYANSVLAARTVKHPDFLDLFIALTGRARRPEVAVIVTCGRAVLSQARAEGTLARLEGAGVQVVADLCWCSISEPVFPRAARTLMTNSGKYAHYAPGLSGRAVRFGSLADCVAAAMTGRAPSSPPAWLA